MVAIRDVKVRARLIIGFGLLLFLLIVMQAVALYGNKLKSNQFNYLTEVNMVKMRLLSGMVVSSQPATVVLPLLVAPAMHTEMP